MNEKVQEAMTHKISHALGTGWLWTTFVLDALFTIWMHSAVQPCPLKTILTVILIIKVLSNIVLLAANESIDKQEVMDNDSAGDS